MLGEHSAEGHAQTMFNLQLKRPTLWEMEADLSKFTLPLLVVVGDEDERCVDGSIYLKRTVPTAGLLRHAALRPYHHQRGAGGVQRRARRAHSLRPKPAAGWRIKPN